MPNIEYKKTNTPWGLEATIDNRILTFSGTFEKNRIHAQQRDDFITKTGIISLWIIFIIGIITTSIQFYPFTSRPDFHKILAPSFYNLGFWIGICAVLFLWAKYKQIQIDESTVRLTYTEQAPRNTTTDIYTLFNKEAQHAWDHSFTIASQYEKQYVTANHLFISLLETKSVTEVFFRMNTNPSDVSSFLKNYELITPATKKEDLELQEIPFIALSQSQELGNETIDPLMILCALKKHLPENHVIQNIFFNIDISLEDLQILAEWNFTIKKLVQDFTLFKKLAKYKSSSEINTGLTSLPTPTLDRFSRDLTQEAKYGRLPMSFGRAQDIIEFSKAAEATNGCAIITGSPGTGRITMIYELAYKMASEQIPDFWQDKRLVLLELPALMASRIPAEQILLNCLTDAEKSGNIVLVMEDIHILAEAQTTNGVSLLTILTDFLTGHNLQILGTSSIQDFTETLSTSANFTQLFSVYEIKQLSKEKAILASCVKASLLEAHGNCMFSYKAIVEAYNLSNIYIHSTNQPEKTITLLTQAAGKGQHSKHAYITPETIRNIISQNTHIPTETLTENEADKLLRLEEEISKSFIGQKEAVTAISESLRRTRSGMGPTNRPTASFLFLGPTGVGKTELAKTLASVYFGKEEYLLRIDMSEFKGQGSVAKLLGSPNSKSDSALITHIKTYPFCLLLLDEFEKADPDIHNLFLQILDDGRLTSTKGETLDLTHCMIIATSNAGTTFIQKSIQNNLPVEEIKKELLENQLLKTFKPELLNRFDGVIIFTPLTQKEIEQVAYIHIQKLQNQLLEKGMHVVFTQNVLQNIASKSYDNNLGARPLRRYMQDHIESFIAKLILSKKLIRGSHVTIDMENDKLIIQ